MQELVKEKSSFRDPDGYIFYQNGQVLRSIEKSKENFYKKLLENKAIQNLITEGKLVNTAIFESRPDSLILSHQKLDLITHPYEWSLSQLLDAALLTLEIQKKLLDENLCLKDATPYNVQFLSHNPIFIDFSSIESNDGRSVWRALNQFLEMFYYPILLHFNKKANLKKIYLDNFNGIKVDEVKELLGTLESFSLGNLFEIGLPYLFRNQQSPQNKESQQDTSKQEIRIRTQKFTIDYFISRLKKIKNKHLKAQEKVKSLWSNYTTDIHYGDNAYNLKQGIIKDTIAKYQPKKVIDLGCNTGDFSVLANQCAEQVWSVDLDINCIDHLYNRAKHENLNITSIWMHLDNPSPGLGWQNQERKSFIERASSYFQADIVLALALIHHLLVSSRIPLEEILSMMYFITNQYLVLEFVEYQDPMFQQIIRSREDIYQNISFEFFENNLGNFFTVIDSFTITSTRKIYILKKNGR
jgi:hypothetical protein